LTVNRILDSVVDQIPQGRPDRIAVSFDGRERITYAELREKSLRYAKRLTSFKVPKYFIQQDQLPRNASGKILKYVLRKHHEKVVDG
jgi:acyl-coenzyme A synthetase/AMP-(fatty) acid ligase